MALHPNFPVSPFAPLIPEHRWFPADEALRSTAYEKLLPPLVANVRKEVHTWRNQGYPGASASSVALLRHWFETEHLTENADGSLSPFRYYFAQREAVESVIWLYEVRRARDKFDLIRFSSLTEISPAMFDEDWPRYVLKMATGAGKTKVLSLLIAWSFFHRTYEPDSALSRNFLVIAPNIIVLDRLRADFDGLKIFFNDPILPPNGHEDHNWRDDFQFTLHIQDDVRVVRETGNLFLMNTRDILTKQWTDWVDYWAVDFNYESRKEIIKVAKNFGTETEPRMDPDEHGLGKEAGQGKSSSDIRVHPRSSVVKNLPVVHSGEEFLDFEERWTGAYIFENEWQSFRTRQNRELELTTVSHTYAKPGRYTIAVKVIDIFGNDTMTLVPVTVG